jgi:hypothetical protein
MSTYALEKPSKVIALSDSGHDGEAMAALRAARSMLRNDGVSLSEVLKGALAEKQAEKQHVQVRGGLANTQIVNSLQREVVQLQIKLAESQRQIREQQAETLHWKKVADDNSRKLKKATTDTEQWQYRAKAMSGKLIALAKAIEDEEKSF